MHPLGLLLICLYIRFVSVKIQIRVQLQLGSYGLQAFLPHLSTTPNRSAALFPCLWIRIKLAGIQLVGLAAAAVICVSHLSGWQTKTLVDKNKWPSGLEIPWTMDFVSKISGASQTFLYRMASLPLYFSSNASKKFTSDSASPNLIKALGADATQNNMKRNMWQWLSHLFLTWTSHIAGWNKFA